MGILVWEQVPVYWNIDWTNPATLQVAEQQMRDLVAARPQSRRRDLMVCRKRNANGPRTIRVPEKVSGVLQKFYSSIVNSKPE
jgi:hypothetical protein